MPKHLWMQDLSTVAYCPKCKALSFKRSNTRSRFERFIRQYSTRVPYRCHSCSYRALVDQTSLRYPVGSQHEYEEHSDFESNIELPEIGIANAPKNETVSDRREDIADPFAEAGGAMLLHTLNGIESAPAADGIPSENEFLAMPEPAVGQSAEPVGQSAEPVGQSAEADVQRPSLHDVFPAIEATEGIHTLSGKRLDQEHRILCPSCGEYAIYRSHSRSMLEALRKKLTSKKTYRCHKCEWRGWM